MRLLSIPLNDKDCRTLVDLLHRVGRADDLELARRIDDNLERRTKLFGLTPADRDLLLGILDDPPPGNLLELRAALLRDYHERQT